MLAKIDVYDIKATFFHKEGGFSIRHARYLLLGLSYQWRSGGSQRLIKMLFQDIRVSFIYDSSHLGVDESDLCFSINSVIAAVLSFAPAQPV